MRAGAPFLVADTAIAEMPTAEELAEIAIEAAGVARRLGYEPRVAMLAFSNFGHPPGERAAAGAGSGADPRRASGSISSTTAKWAPTSRSTGS